MPLTAEDVQNKEFTTVRLREGYDMAEVDEFLDEVEAELARMQRENDELRDKLSAVTRGGGVAGSAEPIPAVRQAEAPMAPPSAVPAGAPPSAPPTEAAAKVLALAQKTADELVADAKAEADRLMSEARERAEKIDAEIKAKSSKVEQEARQRADSIEHEVQQRREQVFGKLESERSQLEHELETLRHFEREYRSRLKSYLEDQLRKLETGDGVNESEHLVRRDADEAERSDEPSGGGNNSTQTGGSLRSVASLLEDDQR